MEGETTDPAEMQPEAQWPAVALAYEFVRPSYDIMLKRFEIVEGRVRALITLAASLTFGAPVFVRAAGLELSYASPWLIAALSFATYILAAGALASVGRRVHVPDPTLLHEASLRHEMSAWTFQRVTLQAAGEAYRANKRGLDGKALLADTMAVALLLEVGCMVAWALLG